LSAFLFLTTAVSVVAGELSASPDSSPSPNSFAGIFSLERKTLTGDWFGEG
jgi:hypothetical protein